MSKEEFHDILNEYQRQVRYMTYQLNEISKMYDSAKENSEFFKDNSERNINGSRQSFEKNRSNITCG